MWLQGSYHPAFSGSSLWCLVTGHQIWPLCQTQHWAGDCLLSPSLFLYILSTYYTNYTGRSFVQSFMHKDWGAFPYWYCLKTALSRTVRPVLTSHCDMGKSPEALLPQTWREKWPQNFCQHCQDGFLQLNDNILVPEWYLTGYSQIGWFRTNEPKFPSASRKYFTLIPFFLNEPFPKSLHLHYFYYSFN